MKLHYILFFTIDLFPICGPAQTDPSPTPDSATTEQTRSSNQTAQSQLAPTPAEAGQSGSSAELNRVVVIGQLDTARDQIVPYLG
ncbi:MAG: hypothetical protein WB586_29165, partial [Chthoniobacterales bacterium]